MHALPMRASPPQNQRSSTHSNLEAYQQLMDKDLLGTRRLGVVRDDFDRDQVGP